jgi:hypothetical protein
MKRGEWFRWGRGMCEGYSPGFMPSKPEMASGPAAVGAAEPPGNGQIATSVIARATMIAHSSSLGKGHTAVVS